VVPNLGVSPGLPGVITGIFALNRFGNNHEGSIPFTRSNFKNPNKNGTSEGSNKGSSTSVTTKVTTGSTGFPSNLGQRAPWQPFRKANGKNQNLLKVVEGLL
jgi:hypothetical protein